MFWFWYRTYQANKFWADYRHTAVGMDPTLHKLLMRTFYPL